MKLNFNISNDDDNDDDIFTTNESFTEQIVETILKNKK